MGDSVIFLGILSLSRHFCSKRGIEVGKRDDMLKCMSFNKST